MRERGDKSAISYFFVSKAKKKGVFPSSQLRGVNDLFPIL